MSKTNVDFSKKNYDKCRIACALNRAEYKVLDTNVRCQKIK